MARVKRHAPGGLLVLLLLIVLLAVACQPPSPPTAAPSPTAAPTVSPPTLFVEPDDGLTPVLAVIQSARRSLDITAYLITHEKIVSALKSAARRGVSVRLLLEQHPYGGGTSNRRAAETLRRGGVRVRFSSPAFRYTHQKSMIVDGHTGVVMTMNFTHSSFTHNREYGIIFHQPAWVAEMQAVFEADWERRPPNLPPTPYLVWSPINSRQVILNLIREARTSLDMEEQDLVDEEVVRALVNAIHRGVKVRLVRPELRKNEEAERHNVWRLRRAGGHVHLISSPYVHAKVIVVDGKKALIGSINLTPTSLDLNRELGVVVEDKTIVHRILQIIERDWQR